MAEITIGIISLIAGALGTFITVDKHYRELRKEAKQQIENEREKYAEGRLKAYAAERDFQHLRRDYEQLKTGQDQLFKEIEIQIQKLEMKICELSGRIEALMSDK